jgi:hypothetical protein
MKEKKLDMEKLSKEFCKLKKGTGPCPGDCMKCLMEYLLYPRDDEID